jgi:phage terminase large subunit
MNNNKIPENANIYADSANPDKIVMIQNAGFKKCVGAKKNVLSGIDFMKSKKIHITKDSINIIKEIEPYSWKLEKNGDAMEQPVKFLDDILDGCRYSIFRGEAIKVSRTHITDRKRENDFDKYDAKEIHHSIHTRDSMLGY